MTLLTPLALTDASGPVTIPVALAFVMVVLAGVGVWAVMLGWRLRSNRNQLRDEMIRMEAQQEILKSELSSVESMGEELTGLLAVQKQKTELHRDRGRILEKILAVSARINATRSQPELLEQVVSAVEGITGFRKVILYLWSDNTQAFEARAFAGIPEESKAALIGIQVSRPEYEEMSRARDRYSNSYLIRAGAPAEDSLSADLQIVPEPLGTERPWTVDLLMISPLISRTGEVKGYFSLDDPATKMVPDIIAIRQLEFLVQQANTAIESAYVYDRLASNNAELSVASKKLASLSDMKANFVANVSHELRTPLTSISAYTELLQQNMDTMSEEARDEFLKVINTESTKLTGIINDILDLSRIGNGPPAMVQVETDLVRIVRHLEESWKSRAVKRNIRFRLETTASEILLPVDSLLLKQLLGHLLGNAFKFTPEGGHVTLRLDETGTAVRLTVEDSGIGIPEDQLGEIFDEFYQVDGSATREHNGQGVGLAICQDIVSHHDGRIWAENVEPSGARFTVLLPRRPAVLQPVVHKAGGSVFEEGEFIQRLMYWISESLGIQTATLMIPEEGTDHLTIRAAIGLPDSVVQSARVSKGTGFAGKVWATGQTMLLADVTEDERSSVEENEPRYSTPSLLCVPLFEESRFVGVLSVNNKIDGSPLDEDDRLFLESLAPRISELLKRHSDWQETSEELKRVRGSLRTTTAVGHLRHESLPAVCQEICLATARRVMLPAHDMEHLAYALQFYDVGLSFVPHQILNKPGRLTDDEKAEMQKHVQVGLEILEPLRPSSKVRQLILHHHENSDGSGYPEGLAGEAIPLGSRLIRLTDTLAALLSDRPWRAALCLDEAVEVIRDGAGREFCPRMADLFLEETRARASRIAELQGREIPNLERVRPVVDRWSRIPSPV